MKLQEKLIPMYRITRKNDVSLRNLSFDRVNKNFLKETDKLIYLPEMTPGVSESQRSLQSTGDSSSGLTDSCSMWNRRSRLEKSLIVTVVLLVAMSVTLATPLAILASRVADGEVVKDIKAEFIDPVSLDKTICDTPGCVKIAATFLQSGNFSKDPCEDFYDYTCSQYEANAVIADHETSMTRFQEVDDSLNARLRTILESPKQENELEVFKKVKDLYTACMNITRINERGPEPLLKLLKTIGGWPVLEGEKWDETSFDWEKTMAELRRQGLGSDTIVEVSVSVDGFNTSNHIIEIDQPSLGMPSRNYLLKGFNDTLVQEYFRLMVSMAVKLGADKTAAERDLEDSLRFEIKLANYTLPMEERRNFTKLYSKINLKKLGQEVPQIDWVTYVGSLMRNEITENELVEVTPVNVIRNILTLVNETKKRTLANYIIWRAVMSTILLLGKDFRELSVQYSAAMTGQRVDSPRWETCLGTVRGTFSNALGSLYTREFFDEQAREKALEMVEDIRDEFREIIDQVDWMDNITRSRALLKAQVMAQMIAYPKELKNNTLLELYYKNVTVDPEDYFGSIMASKRYWTDFKLKKLRQPFNRIGWEDLGAVAVVNAYFNSLRNLIMFPAGILQGIFFGADRPKYVNYGSIGFVIGHEITHGFDDQGRQFDQNGNIRGWWEPETDELYKQRATCIIHQYGNYTLPSEKNSNKRINVNGINTQGENIADNGGVKEAYKAYNKWVLNNEQELPLPGMKNTVSQLFWISYANVWCSKTRDKAVALQVMTGAHSPQRFRVNGVVSNSLDFARDFNCPVGSPMNPVKKCSVW